MCGSEHNPKHISPYQNVQHYTIIGVCYHSIKFNTLSVYTSLSSSLTYISHSHLNLNFISLIQSNTKFTLYIQQSKWDRIYASFKLNELQTAHKLFIPFGKIKALLWDVLYDSWINCYFMESCCCWFTFYLCIYICLCLTILIK